MILFSYLFKLLLNIEVKLHISSLNNQNYRKKVYQKRIHLNKFINLHTFTVDLILTV